jgi:hypothetical protein
MTCSRIFPLNPLPIMSFHHPDPNLNHPPSLLRWRLNHLLHTIQKHSIACHSRPLHNNVRQPTEYPEFLYQRASDFFGFPLV